MGSLFFAEFALCPEINPVHRVELSKLLQGHRHSSSSHHQIVCDNLKLKCKASLARRLLEDIDFTAFLYLCIKTFNNVLIRGIIAGQTLDLCSVLVLSNISKIHLANITMNNTRNKWTCVELWGFMLPESKTPHVWRGWGLSAGPTTDQCLEP